MKLSNFGISGLEDDLVVMTDCQYGGRTMYGVRLGEHYNEPIMNIAKPCNLKCTTHFNLSFCYSLYSGHLEQLTIACPNLQRLNLRYCCHCLKSLQGLRSIASHCQNLQGLNLFGICVSEVEDHILLWEILSDMKLTHFAVEFCTLRPKPANKEHLIFLLRKCSAIRGIECELCDHGRGCNYFGCRKLDTLMLSYLTSLHYCHLTCYDDSVTLALNVVNDCKELKCVIVTSFNLSLNLAHNYNLQQLYIHAPFNDVPDYFVTSVSAHGGLVHTVMDVQLLMAEDIISLVRNSPKLITLYLRIRDGNMENFNIILKKLLCKRTLFTAGYCSVNDGRSVNVLQSQGTDLLSLWNYNHLAALHN